ncbi:TMEM175 family protein [Robertkochia aurantiaca]|uniref:TMEM175 family protein n=1 Tax=Robertkochia aurantiaca TaxID=2873700 RepID=UPI001CCEAFA1|nr:TMEM175 family protein [Robertkochia sp. 3YJGBD-33]
MRTGRLEAFSDGVLAIVITIMVLELKPPAETQLWNLREVFPTFLSYLLSFIYLGIYWNNHHHLFQVTQKVNGIILWANLHLLFWLSLIPFATRWAGQNFRQADPIALYGFILLMAAIAYRILEVQLIKYHDDQFPLKNIADHGKKEYISIFIYIISIPLAFYDNRIAISCFILVAIMWLIPDRRLEGIY